MNRLHYRPDLIPSWPGLPLRQAALKAKPETRSTCASNPFILPMIERTKIQRWFQGPKAPLHFQELLVSKATFLWPKAVSAGPRGDTSHPTASPLSPGPIDLERLRSSMPQISARVDEAKRHNHFFGRLPFWSPGQKPFDLLQGPLPGRLIFLASSGLWTRTNRRRRPHARSETSFYFQIIFDFLELPGGREPFENLLVVPSFSPRM